MLHKHFNFWIGFFVAIFLSVPIAVGVWGVLTDQAAQMVAFLTGLLIGLLILLVGGLFARDRILKAIFRSTQSSLEEIAKESIKVIEAVSDGNREQATQRSGALIQTVLSWYSWTGFYRWVIGTCAAILVAFGAFTGTVLLFEQNIKIAEQTEQLRSQNLSFNKQNELSGLSLVSRIRERLKQDPNISRYKNENYNTIYYSEKCVLEIKKEVELKSKPNQSTLDAIYRLSQLPNVGPEILSALEILTSDQDSGVALGALLILDKANHLGEVNFVKLKSVYFSGDITNYAGTIIFENSHVEYSTCKNCKVGLTSTYVMESLFGEIVGGEFVFVDRAEGLGGGGGRWEYDPTTFVPDIKYELSDFKISADAHLVGFFFRPWEEYENDYLQKTSDPEVLSAGPLAGEIQDICVALEDFESSIISFQAATSNLE